jgi:hypothetical protein
MNTSWAYASNNFIYAAMALYTFSFLAHAFETAWAVRAPQGADANEVTSKKKTLDYSRTEKAARLATALQMAMHHGEICMNSLSLVPLPSLQLI